MLPQLARDQRLAVGALQERNRFEFVSFLGDIDQHPEMAVAVGAQVSGEPREFLGAHLEDAFRPQLPALPDMGRQALGVEVEEAAGNHVLILLMTS